MKLRYRLIISFCIILFVPIIVAGIVLYGLSLLQDRANAQANGYDFIISSIQILNQSTASQYQELSRVAEDNPELLTDIDWLEGENRQLQANGAYLIVRVGDEIICNGDSSKTDIDVDRLPDFGDNEQAEQAAVFLEGSNPALVRQVDFVLEDGTQGTLFLVNTAKSILPEVRRVLLNLVLSILLILLFTAAVLIIWTYSGIVPRIKQLVTATRKIRDGNLNFTIETRGSDEISELSDALEAMRQRLEANAQEKLDAEQEQKELISNIAHDLKTPITAIKGYAEGILDGVADTPDKQERYLRTIYNKANEMNTLINELTLYSKIDTNKIPYNFQKINVKEYFMDCAEELGLDLENQHVHLSYFNYVGDDVTIIADPEQLRRVIHNIVGNSIKYMRADHQDRISIRINDVGDFVQVEIEDNGKGIAKKDLPYIFDRFYRADASRNSAAGGSGIGLSIVKKIIEDHGGKIWATSKEDEGTVMYFVLRKYQEVPYE
ncbi:MAG: sensor histidine kinase [Lachnospiraceae bacterium]